MTSYSILRNVFCVAASRGKNEIIFVTSPTHALLTEEMLLQGRKQNHIFSKPFPIADMFSFKYKEDIEECYRFLKIKKLETKESAIKITSHDGLIDISPCIGIFQEVNFFHDYNIEDTINFTAQLHNDRTFRPMKEDATLEEKILYVTMMETNQERYVTQVKTPFISDEQASQIYDRLGTVFNGNETVQQDCEIEFYDEYDNLCTAKGRVDVVKGDIIYELKFVSELNHEHFLQLACYLVAMNKRKGVLWNIRNNEKYEIVILKKNRQEFLDAVVNTITKGAVKKFRDKVGKKKNDEFDF